MATLTERHPGHTEDKDKNGKTERAPMSPYETFAHSQSQWLEKRQEEKNKRDAEAHEKEMEQLRKSFRSPAPGTAKLKKGAKIADEDRVSPAEFGSQMHHLPGIPSPEERAAMIAVRSGQADTIDPLNEDSPPLPPGASLEPEPRFPGAGAWAMPLGVPPPTNPLSEEAAEAREKRDAKDAKDAKNSRND